MTQSTKSGNVEITPREEKWGIKCRKGSFVIETPTDLMTVTKSELDHIVKAWEEMKKDK